MGTQWHIKLSYSGKSYGQILGYNPDWLHQTIPNWSKLFSVWPSPSRLSQRSKAGIITFRRPLATTALSSCSLRATETEIGATLCLKALEEHRSATQRGKMEREQEVGVKYEPMLSKEDPIAWYWMQYLVTLVSADSPYKCVINNGL